MLSPPPGLDGALLVPVPPPASAGFTPVVVELPTRASIHLQQQQKSGSLGGASPSPLASVSGSLSPRRVSGTGTGSGGASGGGGGGGGVLALAAERQHNEQVAAQLKREAVASDPVFAPPSQMDDKTSGGGWSVPVNATATNGLTAFTTSHPDTKSDAVGIRFVSAQSDTSRHIPHRVGLSLTHPPPSNRFSSAHEHNPSEPDDSTPLVEDPDYSSSAKPWLHWYRAGPQRTDRWDDMICAVVMVVWLGGIYRTLRVRRTEISELGWDVNPFPILGRVLQWISNIGSYSSWIHAIRTPNQSGYDQFNWFHQLIVVLCIPPLLAAITVVWSLRHKISARFSLEDRSSTVADRRTWENRTKIKWLVFGVAYPAVVAIVMIEAVQLLQCTYDSDSSRFDTWWVTAAELSPANGSTAHGVQCFTGWWGFILSLSVMSVVALFLCLVLYVYRAPLFRHILAGHDRMYWSRIRDSQKRNAFYERVMDKWEAADRRAHPNLSPPPPTPPPPAAAEGDGIGAEHSDRDNWFYDRNMQQRRFPPFSSEPDPPPRSFCCRALRYNCWCGSDETDCFSGCSGCDDNDHMTAGVKFDWGNRSLFTYWFPIRRAAQSDYDTECCAVNCERCCRLCSSDDGCSRDCNATCVELCRPIRPAQFLDEYGQEERMYGRLSGYRITAGLVLICAEWVLRFVCWFVIPLLPTRLEFRFAAGGLLLFGWILFVSFGACVRAPYRSNRLQSRYLRCYVTIMWVYFAGMM